MKKLRRKIEFTVEITDTGYSAYSEQTGVYSTGNDIPELHENLKEALEMAFEDSGYQTDAENLRLTVDLQQFFQYYKVLNAKFLAQKIGMNPTLLSQYVRGKKRPSAKQTEKIMLGIQRIGRELAEIQLL